MGCGVVNSSAVRECKVLCGAMRLGAVCMFLSSFLTSLL